MKGCLITFASIFLILIIGVFVFSKKIMDYVFDNLGTSIIQLADTNGDNQLDLEEFIFFAKENLTEFGANQTDSIQTLFNVFDQNQDGVLDEAEIFNLVGYTKKLMTMSNPTPEVLFHAVDINGDQRLDLNEITVILAGDEEQAKDILSQHDRDGDDALDIGEAQTFLEGYISEQN